MIPDWNNNSEVNVIISQTTEKIRHVSVWLYHTKSEPFFIVLVTLI